MKIVPQLQLKYGIINCEKATIECALGISQLYTLYSGYNIPTWAVKSLGFASGYNCPHWNVISLVMVYNYYVATSQNIYQNGDF